MIYTFLDVIFISRTRYGNIDSLVQIRENKVCAKYVYSLIEV
jgi:hypothetical protein